MSGGFLPSHDGAGDSAGGPGLERKRQYVITKLMQRIERRLVMPVNFTPSPGFSLQNANSAASSGGGVDHAML
jgi:hypothetical protein